MTGTLVKGTLLGAIALFAWTAFSWTALPWHMSAFSTFTDEAGVIAAVKKAAPASGVYLLPNPRPANAKLTPAEAQAAMEKAQTQIRTGVSAFAIVHAQGVKMNMAPMMGMSIVNYAVASLLLTWLLLQAGIASYWRRVAFVTVVALAAGILCFVPDLIWWGYPARYTRIELADLTIAGFLGGLVLAKVTGKKRGRR